MRVRISKEHRELAAWAERFGWTWKLTSGTHIRWEHPKVPQPVFSPTRRRHAAARSPGRRCGWPTGLPRDGKWRRPVAEFDAEIDRASKALGVRLNGGQSVEHERRR